MWRYYREAGVPAHLPPAMVALLADVVFTYIDLIEATAAAEHSESRKLDGTERQAQRSRLVRSLIGEIGSSDREKYDLSQMIGWSLPRSVSVVLIPEREMARPLSMLPADILADLARSEPCLLLPDPAGPGRVAALEQALDGRAAVLGPPVALEEAANSVRWARTLLNAVDAGIVPGGGLVQCADHWATLILTQDIDLTRTLVDDLLTPMRDLRDEERDRLAETLLEWLQTGKNACVAAERLYVHPQTIRYRVRKLCELFGQQLEDPNAQKSLIIALSAYRLLKSAKQGRTAQQRWRT